MADPMLSEKIEERKPSSFLNHLHIALDTYEDIFSDFDPSGYEHRIFSDDFLKEIQKRYVENRKGDVELRFSIPAVMRSAKIESLVKKRLKEYFQLQIKEFENAINVRRWAGAKYFMFGFVVLMIVFLIETSLDVSAAVKALATLMTPLGWFGMWEGTSLFVQAPIKYETEKKFYVKFSKANYVFINEEDFLRELSLAENADLARGDVQKKP